MTPIRGRGWARIWLATAAGLLTLWLWGLSAAPLSLRADVLYHTEPIGEIYGRQTVGQTFLAPYDGLYQVEVSLADYGRLNSGPVTFSLKPAPGSPEVLAVTSFPAEGIRGDQRQALSFPPLHDSSGRSYYLELWAPQAVPGNAITAYFQPEGDYAEGQAYRAGAPAPGDLVFGAYFRAPVWQRAGLWLEQVGAGKPGVFGQAGFVVLLGAAGVTLITVLLGMAGAPQAGPDASDEAER